MRKYSVNLMKAYERRRILWPMYDILIDCNIYLLLLFINVFINLYHM